MFGPHVDRVHAKSSGRPSITEHIRAARASAAAVDFDARVFQVFVAGPRNLAMTMRPEEADELKKYLDGASAGAGAGAGAGASAGAGAGTDAGANTKPRLAVVAHGTYMDFPWHGKPHPAHFIRQELEMCARAGIFGLVVHLGKPPIAEVMKYIPRLISAERETLIYLEVPHVKPENSHYETPEKLAALFREIRTIDKTLCRFGLCIDTAHLWSCGVDLQSFEDGEDWLRRLEAVADVIPPDRIIFHLNDSLDTRGSGIDHHAALLEGKIWGEYKDQPAQSGLAAFVNYAVRNNIPTILERKPPEALLGDYAVIERLAPEVRLDG